MGRGVFITFEGGEGAGKTTQISRLANWLKGQGRDCVLTREPGGTDTAESIRDLMFAGKNDFLPVTDLLLMNAARADHVRKKIRPSLENGKWVLCDRFADSTRVYQALDGVLSDEMIEQANRIATGGMEADLTLLFDLDPQIGLERRQQAGDANRFDEAGLATHQQIRQRFLDLAHRHESRFAVIDASRPVEIVSETVTDIVQRRLLS